MLERLNQLDTNLNELLKFKRSVALSHIKKDLQKQWILWYGLFESIQIVIHIACHLTAKYHLGNPETYT
ncbi:DUF86 domain-containing protein, partial [candidate division KSB1 bacterium]|nr:DUF86 domain-containing protein [candidate division KSB1 bacterium]